MNFVQKRLFFYFLSFILIIFGSLGFYIFQPNLGIDLIGGQILEVKTKADVKKLIFDLKIKANVFETKESFLIKSPQNLNQVWQEIRKIDLQAQRLRFESISSSLSAELRKKAFLMIFIVLLAIATYVAFAFYKLKNHFSIFNLAFVVVFTLFHDIFGATGFYLLLANFFNFDLDIKFITALLIVAGFSVHDTIVVFDRLRENILKQGRLDKTKKEEIFNSSIHQTLRRSIFTSLTTVLAILPLTLIIPDLRAFLLAIQIGIIIGTYSSICLATPLLYETHRS